MRIADLKHAHQVLERAYHIMVANETVLKFEDCDVLVRPKGMADFSMFSFRNMDAIFELGYIATLKALKNDTTLKMAISKDDLGAERTSKPLRIK